MEKTIIAIARQYGSSGRMVGRKRVGRLQMRYYDREFLRLACIKSGLDEQRFVKADEKRKQSFFDHIARKKYRKSWISPDSDEFTAAEKKRQRAEVAE